MPLNWIDFLYPRIQFMVIMFLIAMCTSDCKVQTQPNRNVPPDLEIYVSEQAYVIGFVCAYIF